MKKALIAAAVSVCALSVGTVRAAGPTAPQKPNIIILLADDLGYGDLGVQGDRQVATPNIDALAAKGVRLTDYYANHPVCSPSRAALLTGRYQQRMGFEFNSGSPRNTSPIFGLPPIEITIAQRLKSAGYATGMFGKWHVGFQPDRVPTSKGFDQFYGFLSGAHAYTPGSARGGENSEGRGEGAVGGGRTMLRGVSVEPMPAHTTEAFASEASAFIEANKAHPFFVYLPFNAVHAPMDTTSAYYARFTSVANETRRVHLAQLAALDDAVGKVVETVERNGLARRTLIVFISDNGGPTQQTTSSNGTLNGAKGLVLEGGIRVPGILRWDGQLPAGKVSGTVSMSFDITATALSAAGVMPSAGLDGVDLRPFLTEAGTDAAHGTLFWRSGPQGAVRAGDWKLIRAGERRYLFDLAKDRGERHDLSASQPERVKALDAKWQAWSANMKPPLWVRNELAGGDRGAETRGLAAIESFVSGERPKFEDPE